MGDPDSHDAAPHEGLPRTVTRYAIGVAFVVLAFVLKKLLEPITGTGAPFVLFFGAVVATTLWAGPSPGIFAAFLCLPLGAYVFVVRAGYSVSQATFQAALFAVDGLVVVCLAYLAARARHIVERSKAELRDLIELAPDAFLLADLEGRFTDVNQAACRMLGYERQELVGKTIADVISTEELPRLAAVRAQLLASGEIHRAEWTHRRKDGVLVPVEVSSKLLPGGRWQAFARDISERKRVEEALRVSEARFSGIISISADAIVSVDEDQRIVLFNDGAQKIFGYPPSEALGAPLDILIPERLRARHREHVAAFAAGSVAARRVGERLTTIMGRRRNGEEFPAEAAISKLEVGGRSILTVAVRDVTERQLFEREQGFLSDAGALLSTSLDDEETVATLGRLAVRDVADWCVVHVADESDLAGCTGITCADPKQADLAKRVERVAVERLPRAARTVMSSRRPLVVEEVTAQALEWFGQNEEERELLRAIAPRSVMALPLLTRGQPLGVLTFISTTRSYGPADRRLAEALAQRAAFAIENGRLYQRALHATQLRDQVLGVVAHDLRNPVAAIVIHTQLLRRKLAAAPGVDENATDRILSAATLMNRLIGDLLDVTLIEAGQLGVERVRVSTEHLLRDCVEAQRPLATTASLELQLEVPSDLPEIWGDPQRLLQVLDNLVGNAIKFTPAEGHITVGAAAKDIDVLFWVADTGGGIPPESIPHVFDRFWQAKKEARRGAGLGLPIARGIVEAHGGRMWVESAPGRGSVFFFTIPQASPAEARPSAIH